jgi:alanyl-tRNA synthetase
MSQRPILTHEIREAFLAYFESKGHQRVASSRLIPDNDPTLLFTNAGMVQFKDCFLGLDKRDYTRATTTQKCVRAGGKHNDLENVGFTARHHTFFEMLGNFSFGDYFKEEAILFAWDFVTNVLKLPQDRLRVSVFEKDDEGAEIWHKKVGLPLDKIVRFGEKDNFWAMGDTGPCGPCSEIFWDQGREVDGDRWLEFWNCVFMQFDRQADGTLVPLAKPSVDTGMGLERMAAVMQAVPSNYDIDLMKKLITGVHSYIEAQTHQKLNILSASKEEAALRVIVDHMRSTGFLLADGVLPSSEGRGYVLRRILRRALRFGKQLGLKGPFLADLYPLLKNEMGNVYPELKEREKVVRDILQQEEEKFFETLEKGLHLLEEAFSKSSSKKSLDPALVFRLYDTYGFPVDLTELIARERSFTFDHNEVQALMSSQQERSRASWKGSGAKAPDAKVKEWKSQNIFPKPVFYEKTETTSKILAITRDADHAWVAIDPCPFYAESGGQVSDHGTLKLSNQSLLEVEDVQKVYEGGIALLVYDPKKLLKEADTVLAKVDDERRRKIRANHTGTHLLHASLRKVLGTHVAQAGSVVDDKRLRFDFSHPKSVSQEDLQKIESDVNAQIEKDISLSISEKSINEAKAMGAMALFGEKYGDNVRVVEVPSASIELCGGLHVSKTGEIKYLKILSEGGVASGTRRIEAITGDEAILYFQTQEKRLLNTANILKVSPEQLEKRVEQILDNQKNLEKEILELKRKIATGGSSQGKILETKYKGISLKLHLIEDADVNILRQRGDHLRQNDSSCIHILWANPIIMVTANVEKLIGFHSGNLLSQLAKKFGGKGGGQDKSAQGQIPLPPDGAESLLAWIAEQK